MATTRRKVVNIAVDENNTQNLQRIKITKGISVLKASAINANEKTKRAALGELGNRAAPIALKNKVQKDVGTKIHINLRSAKPRVDTHWKNPPVLGSRNLIRTESLKNIASKKPNTGSTEELQRATSDKNITEAATKPSKLTRVTSNRVITTKQTAIIKKDKDDMPIRREDSQLSRRSLTKLRAALLKDHKKINTNIITEPEKPKENVQSNNASIEKICTKEAEKICTKEAEKTSTMETEKTSTMEAEKICTRKAHILPDTLKIINDIDDIDINDNDNLHMLPEYVNDIYSYLYHLEYEFPIKIDHMKNQIEITPRMRSVLLDWINEVSSQFHLLPETYQMTVSIIDRYLQAIPSTSRKHLQLVGATAIFLASKYEELLPPDVSDFVYITDHTYSKSQMFAMERKIFRALEFQLSRPIPIIFLRRYSKAAKAEKEHHVCAKYILELATLEYSMAYYKPSEVAAAALLLSLQLFNPKKLSNENLWTPTLQYYSRYQIENLRPIVKKMAKLIHDAPKSQNKAVYEKFKTPKFDTIAIKKELYGSVIAKFLI